MQAVVDVEKMLSEKVKVFAPSKDAGILNYLKYEQTYSMPFADERISVLSDLSEMLLKNKTLRSDPATVALAYWLRKAEITRLKQKYESSVGASEGLVHVSKGNVFHIAPSNVDTLFVYSWALSFLCGNSNIVRVSSETNDVVLEIINCINDLMEKSKEFKSSNRFVTYAHSNEITEEFSKWSNHRVIWGGDETVSKVRPLYLDSHSSERIFGSKFSYAVISASWFNNVNDDDVKKLASSFFNDMFWFDQMACSSPHIAFWVGSKEDVESSVIKFNNELQSEIDKRGYKSSVGVAVKRLNYAFEKAASKDLKVDLNHKGFISLEMTNRNELEKDICGGGLITHVQIDNLNDLSSFVDKKDQTITRAGFKMGEIKELAKEVGSKGICRIVPIGEALSFSFNWDGYDLLSDFTKKISVK